MIDLYKGDCLKREDGVTYIATISGGKDSVAMTDLLCKNGYPVDYIIFQDTMAELPLMYEYIDKLKDYFMSRYNKEITVLKPKSTFEEWCFGVIKDKNADKFGWIRGIPMVWSEPCFWRREAKQKPSDKFLKVNEIKEATYYIGYTYGENRSIQDSENIKFKYPLKDDFKMTERNCQEYLINQEMENPLYRYFSRTGCGFCPAMSEKASFEIWKNFKETWEYMKQIEKRLLFYKGQGFDIKNSYWFPNFVSISEYEEKFIKADVENIQARIEENVLEYLK